MDTLPSLVSESEAPRKCNLPSTPRWRSFLRDKLEARDSAGAKLYSRFDVEMLAAQVASFAAEVIHLGEPEGNSSNTREERRGLQTR